MAKKTPKGEPAADFNTDDYTPISAPEFFSSHFQINHTSNQFTIVFNKLRQLAHKQTREPSAALLETAAVITLSPQSAKDLSVLLAKQLRGYEKEWGELRTQYIKTLSESTDGKKT